MAYGQGMGGGPDSSGVEGLGADAFGGGNTNNGADGGADPTASFDSSNAIDGMANALDNAANAIQGPATPSNQDPSGLGYGSGLDVTAPAMMGEDPSGLGFGGYGSGLNNASPSVSLDSLSDQPSLGELSAAIGVDPSTLGSVNPSDDPSGLGYGSGLNLATVEQESPGQKAAAFLDDFNQGMQFDPSAAPVGVGTNQSAVEAAFSEAQKAEQEQAAYEAWVMDTYSPPTTVGGPQVGAWNNPNYSAWDNPNTAYSPIEAPNYSAWENPNNPLDTVENTMRSPAPGLAFGVNSVEEAMRSPTPGLAYGVNSVEEAMRSPAPAYSAWQNPNTVYSPLENPNYPAWENPNTAYSPIEAPNYPAWENPNTTDTTPAPKYGPKKSEEMYPGHAKKAAMAGVASIKSMFDGSHQSWIDDINEDMENRGIALSHTLDGKAPNGIPFGQEGTNLSGKHSAANWGEYDAMFSPNENGVPVDENGIAMPGTEKQAQAGLGGVLQGLWGGMLSGLAGSTTSGVVDQTANENIPANIKQEPTGPGDAEGPEYPLDIMRSIYPWAESLPDSVLFNAIRYPDYLRLLIEADASGTELPLVVPKWILDGESAPVTSTNTSTSTSTGTNWITNHPALQIQKPPPGWGVPTW